MGFLGLVGAYVQSFGKTDAVAEDLKKRLSLRAGDDRAKPRQHFWKNLGAAGDL